MEVYVPVSEADARGPKLAPRLDTFDGKRVGILWNHRVHGDRLLKRIRERLLEEYEPLETSWHQKVYHGEPMPPELLEEVAAACDAVITGVGD